MANKNPWHRNRLIRDGIYKATYEEMVKRPEIYILGEGSHMKIHFDAPDIEKEFSSRVITLPISEDANSNFAVGMSLAGIVPIVDVTSSDFLYRTMDAICNTMAKAAVVGRPRTMIVRAEFMTGGPTSGQRIEALFARIPGLRVAVPSNPNDAYGLMKEALNTEAVTVFFEERMIEDAEIPDSYRNYDGTSWKGPRLVKSGSKATVISYGITARFVEEALKDEDCTVLDLRMLYPLYQAEILKSVQETKRLLVVEPDVQFLGIGAEILAMVSEMMPSLDGVKMWRLGAPRATIPASRERHDEIMPSKENILTAYEGLTR